MGSRVVDVAIVGSGFSGIGMGIALARTGIRDFVILEKADDLGGTWRDNTYPGCACDVPSYLYSYSFAPNPGWSRMFASQREIWDYLRECVRRFGLTHHLEYGAEVIGATWDEDQGRWLVEIAGAKPISCRFLVSAMGALQTPRLPRIPGIADFRGPAFHSSQWRHDVDLAGKRVAVVGTGASGVQVVPALARRVGRLDVYQRTAAWILPRPDRPIRADERRRYAAHPVVQRAARDLVYWVLEARGAGFTISRRFQPLGRRTAEGLLRRQVRDPQLRDRLTPDYEFGCKRVLLSSDFYPALQRRNVSLIGAAVSRLTPTGVVDAHGVERPTDAIVFATGFELAAGVRRTPIIGRGGVALGDLWKAEGVNAHLGIMVGGFPNLFMLLGPNTGLGHTSVVFMIESQIHFVIQALRLLDSTGGRDLAVRAEAQHRTVQRVQRDLVGSVWQSGCRSWYRDDNGRNIAIWPHTTMRYWLETRRLRHRDFDISAASPVAAPGRGGSEQGGRTGPVPRGADPQVSGMR